MTMASRGPPPTATSMRSSLCWQTLAPDLREALERANPTLVTRPLVHPPAHHRQPPASAASPAGLVLTLFEHGYIK